MSSGRDDNSRRGAGLVVASMAAALVGLALAAFGSADEMLVSDEWHAPWTLARIPASELLLRVTQAHVSQPLALYYAAVMEMVGLNELLMRLPGIVAFTALVAATGLVGSRALGGAGPLAGWLVALSPLMVFHARTARPYCPATLCALGAAVAAMAWWRTGRLRWGAAYAALAGATAWLLPVFVPFAVAPPVVLSLAWALGISRPAKPRPLPHGMIVLTTLGLMLVVLGPAALASAQVVRGKVAAGHLDPQSILVSARMLLGASWPAALVALPLLAIGGAVLARRHPGWIAYWASVASALAAVVLVVRPAGIEAPAVLARYLLPLLPLAALLVACGAHAVIAALRRPLRRPLQRVIASVLLASLLSLWFFTGPLPPLLVRPNQWSNAILELTLRSDARALGRLVPEVPAFYRKLSTHPPGSLRLLLASSFHNGSQLVFAAHQQVHRQWVTLAFGSGYCHPPVWGEVPAGDHRFEWRNAVHLVDARALASAEADFIVFHKDVAKETGLRGRMPPTDIGGCIERMRSTLARPPDYEDDTIVVFGAGTF